MVFEHGSKGVTISDILLLDKDLGHTLKAIDFLGKRSRQLFRVLNYVQVDGGKLDAISLEGLLGGIASLACSSAKNNHFVVVNNVFKLLLNFAQCFCLNCLSSRLSGSL